MIIMIRTYCVQVRAQAVVEVLHHHLLITKYPDVTAQALGPGGGVPVGLRDAGPAASGSSVHAGRTALKAGGDAVLAPRVEAEEPLYRWMTDRDMVQEQRLCPGHRGFIGLRGMEPAPGDTSRCVECRS